MTSRNGHQALPIDVIMALWLFLMASQPVSSTTICKYSFDSYIRGYQEPAMDWGRFATGKGPYQPAGQVRCSYKEMWRNCWPSAV